MKTGPNTDFFITNMTSFINTKVTCQNLTIISRREGQIRSDPVFICKSDPVRSGVKSHRKRGVRK